MPAQTNGSVSNTGHTPGPWQFIDGGEYFEIHHQDAQAEPGALALVCWADEEDKASEAVANARLIASAPELLRCLSRLVQLSEDDGSEPTYAWKDAFEDAARTVVKAEGRAP